jgi:hypothetical protein
MQQTQQKAADRGIKEVVSSVYNTVTVAVERLKENEEEFEKAVEQAKSSLGIIVEGSKTISKGAEGLLVVADFVNKILKGLLTGKKTSKKSRSAKPQKRIAENFISDRETAMQFIEQSIDVD